MRRRMKRPMVAALAATPMLCFGLTIGGISGVASAGTPLPGATNCEVFPPDNVLNTPVVNLPVNPLSAQWLAAMDASTTNIQLVHGATYGMPITVVPASQPLVNITFTGSGSNDPGPYPFDQNTGIEGGPNGTGDRHALMVDPANCLDYELGQARYNASGSTAAHGAIWNMNSNQWRSPNVDTVNAAGLPIMPLVARYDELEDGAITHAIRVEAETSSSFIWPAITGSGSPNPNLPPMGARFRLSASFNISGYSPQVQVVLRALQQYGLILADNGPNWHFFGDANTNWPDAVTQAVDTVPASAFQAVDESSLEISPDSGKPASSASP